MTKDPWQSIRGSQSNVSGNVTREDFINLLKMKLQSQEEIDKVNKANSNKTGKELKLVHMRNGIYVLQHGLSSYTGLNKKPMNSTPYIA